MIQYRRGLILLSLAAFAITQLCAAPAIGVATTRGSMEVDNASVRGTANLSDGSSVRTNETSTRLQLQNGVQATLGQNSAAAVYSSRIELREGMGQVTANDGFELSALGFHISPSNGKGVARVKYDGSDRILVTAVESAVKVSKDGVLLARVNPGTTYSFEQEDQNDGQTAQSAGKTARKGGKVAGKAAKAGLSTGAKWGIVAAVGAGAGVGLGVGLSGSDASR